MAQTLVTGFSEPFVDTHPFYRSTFIPARTVVRAATGSGDGSASVAHTNYEQRLGQLTDFSFPYRFGGRFYLGVRAVITVTATASGLGTASSFAVVLRQRQGTGSGIGSETSVRIRVPRRSASGSGVGTESSTRVRIVLRTATGLGVGSTTSQVRVDQLTDFSFPFNNGGRFYLGPAQKILPIRTATGSGLGTESAARLIKSLRTATGSGTGTSTATRLIKSPRTATGSGAGSAVTVARRIRYRDATGSGTGTSAVTQLRKVFSVGTASAGTGSSASIRVIIRSRPGTGFGTATAYSVAYGLHISPRTASGLSTESSAAIILHVAPRTATGSGAGSEVSVHYKFHMFRPPVELVGPFMLLHGDKIANKLGRRFEPFERGKNVYQLNDLSFTENDPWSPDNYLKVFHGGHVHALTEDEYTDLVAAGYGANIT